MGSTNDIKTQTLFHVLNDWNHWNESLPRFKPFKTFQSSKLNKQNLRLPAQLLRLRLVKEVIIVFRIDNNPVYFPCPLSRNVAIANVVEHPRRVAFQRVAQAAATGGFQADDIAGV
jgi:hypothetical protein